MRKAILLHIEGDESDVQQFIQWLQNHRLTADSMLMASDDDADALNTAEACHEQTAK